MKESLLGKKPDSVRSIILKKENGQEHLCLKLKTLIGRGPFCDIYLQNPEVSLLHGAITYHYDGSITISDLGSSNGIEVNGKRVKNQIIQVGDSIKIGQVHFYIAYGTQFIDLASIRENSTLELSLKEVQAQLEIAPTPIPRVEKPKVYSPGHHLSDLTKDFFFNLEDGHWRDYAWKEQQAQRTHLLKKEIDIEDNIFDEEYQGQSVILSQTKDLCFEITVAQNDRVENIYYIHYDLDKIYLGATEGTSCIPLPQFKEQNKETFLYRTQNEWKVSSKYAPWLFSIGDDQVEEQGKLSKEGVYLLKEGPSTIYIRTMQAPPEIELERGLRDKFLLKSLFISALFSFICFFTLLNIDYIKEKENEKKVVAVIYKKPPEEKPIVQPTPQIVEKPKPEVKTPPEPKPEVKKVSKKVVKKNSTPPKLAQPKFKLNFKSSTTGNFQKSRVVANTDRLNRDAQNQKIDFKQNQKLNLAQEQRNDNQFSKGELNVTKSFLGKKSFQKATFSTKTVVLGAIDPDAVRVKLRQYLPQFRHCYQKELDLNSESVQGVIDLSFRIEGDGRVSKVDLRSRSNFSGAGKGCISGVLKKIQFPKPKGGGVVDIRQPLNFASSKG